MQTSAPELKNPSQRKMYQLNTARKNIITNNFQFRDNDVSYHNFVIKIQSQY